MTSITRNRDTFGWPVKDQQRLRAKLEVAQADLSIEAIHGYGFRVIQNLARQEMHVVNH